MSPRPHNGGGIMPAIVSYYQNDMVISNVCSNHDGPQYLFDLASDPDVYTIQWRYVSPEQVISCQQLLDDVIADSTPSFATMCDHWTWYLTVGQWDVIRSDIYMCQECYELIREMYAPDSELIRLGQMDAS
mgnify:CR=1 FL=1